MKVLAFDANSIVNRAFYGVRLLSTREGTYTNAVYGFFNIVYKMRSPLPLICTHPPSGTKCTNSTRAPARVCRRNCASRCRW